MFYDKRSRENIEKLASNTKRAALQWYDFCVKNNIEILIYETLRTEEKQREYVRAGKSQTMRSYHLVGQALDFVPADSAGKIFWDGYERPDIQKAIAEAKRLGFEWGGDWKSFVDKPHLQFPYKGYGTDPFEEKQTEPSKPVTPTPKKEASKGNSYIKTFQSWLNKQYNAGLVVDGIYGPKTKRAAIKAFQSELNKQYGARLVVDGYWGPKTRSATINVRKNARGNIVRIIQGMLHCHGFNPGTIDGIFGKQTASAVLAFQKAKGLAQDAIVGKNTFAALFA